MKKSRLFLAIFLVGFLARTVFAETDSTESSPTESHRRLSDLFLKRSGNSSAEVPKPTSRDAVVLYASRLAKPVTRMDEIPANVTLKDRADLLNQSPSTFQDAVKDAEGVILFDSVGNGWDQTFGLRGFTDSSAVTFLVDGVRVNGVDGNFVIFPLIAMDDVESIEIQRGSSSPVYGAGSFAGVVNIETARPSEKLLHLFGGLEFSSFKGVRFHQGVSGTIKDKHLPWDGRLTYYFDGGRLGMSEGFRDNNESRMSRFNIKTGFELPDNQGGIRVGVKHADGHFSNPGEMTFQQFVDDPDRSNKPLDFRSHEETIVQIDADKKFWDDRLRASFLNSWRFHDQEFQTTTGSFTDFVHGYDPDTHRVDQKSKGRDLVWQLEYQDSWTSWLSDKTSIGMEHQVGKDHALQLNAFQGVLQPLDGPDTDRGATAKSTALFWRETLGLWDRLYLYYGMRQDYDSLQITDFLNGPSGNITNQWHQLSQSVGITVKPFPVLDIFSNYSQGFRVPTISDIAPFTSGISTDLTPVKSDSYEVGSRVHWKDIAAIKTSFFLIDLENEIAFDGTAITPSTPFGRNINIGKSRRKGLELRLDSRPLRELYLYFSHTWTSARVRETDSDGVPFDNRSLGQVPEHRLTFGSTLAPFKSWGEPYAGFKVSMEGVFTGKQHPTSYESSGEDLLTSTGYWIKSFSVWNFKVSQEWRGLQIYLKVNNIFGTEYFDRAVAATSFGTSIYAPGNYLFVNPGAPREFVWGLTWGF